MHCSYWGGKDVVLKPGDRGCFVRDSEASLLARSLRASPLSTAAGDVFNGALAVALAKDMSISKALRFANAAADISVTRMGAQALARARADVEAFLAARSVEDPLAGGRSSIRA